jgi:putative transposase
VARPLRIQYSGAFYHVTCRGNKHRVIFLDRDDRFRFLKQLRESLNTYQVVLHAYVMMNNHFHLILQTLRPNLSEFMRRFNICYTGWFNYHHKTCGHLYQGRYKALLVDADSYLLELSRYVHLNPVRIGDKKKINYQKRWNHLRKYSWSSLSGYIDKRRTADFLNYEMTLAMIGGRNCYQQFLKDGLRSDISNPFVNLRHQAILGDDSFLARVKSGYLEDASTREQPMYRELVAKVIPPNTILTTVARALHVEARIFSLRLGNGINRGIVAELLYRYSSLSQQEIGNILGGINYTAVSMLRHRLKIKMNQEKKIKALYDKAEQSLLAL